MTKPKPERTIATLQRVLKELGNVSLEEAINMQKWNKKRPTIPGRRPWWVPASRVNIYLCVEEIRRVRGIGPRQACREVGKFYGYTPNVIAKQYVAGRRHFNSHSRWLRNSAVIFHKETAPPALKKFLQKSNQRRK
jgi:hypothetical protein